MRQNGDPVRMAAMPPTPKSASPFRKRLAQTAAFCILCGAAFILGSIYGNKAWYVFRILAGLFGFLLLSSGAATALNLWQTRHKSHR